MENQNTTQNYWIKPEQERKCAKHYGYANFPNQEGKTYHANLSTSISDLEDSKTLEHKEKNPELWEALENNSSIVIDAPPFMVKDFPLELLKNLAITLNEAYDKANNLINEWESEHGNLGTIEGTDYSNNDRTGEDYNSDWMAEELEEKLGGGISSFITHLSHLAGLNQIERRLISKGEADRIATEWANLPRQQD